MSDQERSARKAPEDAGRAPGEGRYDVEDAREDTGAPPGEIAAAWRAAEADAQDDADADAGVPTRSRRPPDVYSLDSAADPPGEDVLAHEGDRVAFDTLENLDSDDADLPGRDPDISGAEDIDAIDVDTDPERDETISDRDVSSD